MYVKLEYGIATICDITYRSWGKIKTKNEVRLGEYNFRPIILKESEVEEFLLKQCNKIKDHDLKDLEKTIKNKGFGIYSVSEEKFYNIINYNNFKTKVYKKLIPISDISVDELRKCCNLETYLKIIDYYKNTEP